MLSVRHLLCVMGILAVTLPGEARSQSREAPAPEVVSLQTRDGVQLKATYYPSPLRGTERAKQVTPVVLLHDYKDTRATLAPLAQQLQAAGDGDREGPSFAVVALDLRGHGESTVQVLPNGQQVELDAAKLDRNWLIAMASLDMEALRAYLVMKNDAGELNLNKLALVGAGMGANVAANWALQDWAAPPLAVGKQGQDVKAMSLISPSWSYRGLSMRAPLRSRPLMQAVAWQLIYGEQDVEAKADVRRIENQLERYHPKPAEGAPAQARGLVVVPLDSKLQGGTLVSRVGAPIEEQIVRFLVENVASKQLPWLSRRTRLP